MINNMSASVSYIHCYVIYEEITEIMRQAIDSLQLENSVNNMDLSAHLKETQSEKDHDPEQFYITEPTEVNKNQEKFFYPTVIAFKTDGVYHGSFRALLEGLYEILRVGGADKNLGFKNQEDLHWYRVMRFAANLYFLINDFIRPTTSTILNYQCFPEEKGREGVDFHEKSVFHLPYIEENLLLVRFFSFFPDFKFF